MPKGATTTEAPATAAPTTPTPAAAAPTPKPKTAAPAAGTAPRRPKTSAAAAPPAGPSLGQLLEASRSAREQPYLEAIGRVEKLRQMGQIGPSAAPMTASGAIGLGQMVGVLPKPTLRPSATQYATMQPMTIPAAQRPVPTGVAPSQRAPMVVRPTQAPTPLTSEELETQTPRKLAQRAMETGKQFSDAIGAYEKGRNTLRTTVRSPDVAKSEFPALAAEQRKRLEAVLNLAAQMREYGFVGTNEELIGQFAPK